MEMLDAVKDKVTDEDYHCAKYVIEERDRVLAVSDALTKGDYALVSPTRRSLLWRAYAR